MLKSLLLLAVVAPLCAFGFGWLYDRAAPKRLKRQDDARNRRLVQKPRKWRYV